MSSYIDTEVYQVEYCEWCDREVNAINYYAECGVCHAEGCISCMTRGDDVFPYICKVCRDTKFARWADE